MVVTLGPLLYRRVRRGIMAARCAPHHLDDLRFLVDPAAFSPLTIAPASTFTDPVVNKSSSTSKRTTSSASSSKSPAGGQEQADGVHVRLPLPDDVVRAVCDAALGVARSEFRNIRDGPDAARAFWAIKRLEDIAKGDVPSGNGLFYDDTTAVSTLRVSSYPYASRFLLGATSLPARPQTPTASPTSSKSKSKTKAARSSAPPSESEAAAPDAQAPVATACGAEDTGAVVVVRSTCVATDRGPVRFHLRLTVVNNDSVYPMHIVNTHFFAVSAVEPHTLTELISLMPLVNVGIKPTPPGALPSRTVSHESDGGNEKTSARQTKAGGGGSSGAGDDAAPPVGLPASTLEFDVVVPVETEALVRGVLYYCHAPATTQYLNPAAAPAAAQSAPGARRGSGGASGGPAKAAVETLLPARHAGATAYGTLRALHFGPLKLDPAVTRNERGPLH